MTCIEAPFYTVAIATTGPANPSRLADWVALTAWTDIADVLSISERGVQRNVTSMTPVDSGIFNAADVIDYGTVSMRCQSVPLDSGQQQLAALVGDRKQAPLRILHSTGRVEYLSARVLSFAHDEIRDPDAVHTRTAVLAANHYLDTILDED